MYIEQRCGAWQVGDDPDGGVVEFRLFFPPDSDPEIERIDVVGSFQETLGGIAWDAGSGLPLRPARGAVPGTFWTGRTPEPLEAGFYEYKYVVTFTGGEERIVSDPCTRYGGRSEERAAVVVGGTTARENRIQPVAGGRQPLSEL